MTQHVRMGDTVAIEYIGTLDNGRIFDSTDGTPRQVTLGAEQLFPALEAQLLQMQVGETRNIELDCADAYGPRREENLLKVARDLFPAGRELRIGEKLNIELGPAGSQQMRVRAVSDDTVLLDGNHDLAGCHLTFALKLVGIGKN